MDLDTLTSQLTDRLDVLEATVRGHLPLDRFTAPDPIVRTTWPRRLLWTAVGFAAGTAAAWLGDPERGRARRTELQERMAATGADLTAAATRGVDRARRAGAEGPGEGAEAAGGEHVPTGAAR